MVSIDRGTMIVHDILDALTPQLPTTFISWLHILALALAGAVKVFRGAVMQQRARRIDLFGWSIISFDYVFGTALLVGTLWTFYPRLHTEYLDLFVTLTLVSVTLWQGFTVWSAPDHRIDRALTLRTPVREDGTYIGDERRQVVRREADKQMLSKIEKLENQL